MYLQSAVTSARFPTVNARAGMYESFYLRAVSPTEPVGVWIRYTVHKRPGASVQGSVWCTVFDASRGRPFQHKQSTDQLSVPAGGWIAVGDSQLTPALARGSCGAARWQLGFTTKEPELRYLPREWLYRAPLPRTKLTSPAPAARFDGTLELPDRTLQLEQWPGMVGHNWGSEHAERWIWLHGIGFAEQPGDWLDVALGRVRIAGRLTPWVANGVISLDGRRHRLGGFGARGLRVHETVDGAQLSLPGRDGLRVQARVTVPRDTAAGWRYANPDGGEHDVVNCSIAELELTVDSPTVRLRTLHTAHGGVYELGMHEHDHGVPLAPFSDG
jgi:hypothetical protein